jgi:uncharacterized delta-60 repeat protein
MSAKHSFVAAGRRSVAVALASGFAFAAIVFGGRAASAAAAATAADPNFGVAGIAAPALPPAAAEARAGIVDLAEDPGGGVYAALTGLGKPAFFGLARLDEAGVPDPAFGSAGFAAPFVDPAETGAARKLDISGPEAVSLAVQPDGKVVVAGALAQRAQSKESGRTFEFFQPLLVRYLPDGSLDPTFGSQGSVTLGEASDGIVRDVVVMGDGKIVAAVGAGFRAAGGGSGLAVYALRPDGSPDPSFGIDGKAVLGRRQPPVDLRALAPLPNGGLLAAGFRYSKPVVTWLRPDGRVDHAYGGGDGSVRLVVPTYRCCRQLALALAPDGVSPTIAFDGGVRRERVSLARFGSDGGRDRRFGKEGMITLPARFEDVNGIAVAPDGATIVAGIGQSRRRSGGFAYAVARIGADGSLDASIGVDGVETVERGAASIAGTALTLPGGEVLVGGSYQRRAGKTALLLSRYSPG